MTRTDYELVAGVINDVRRQCTSAKGVLFYHLLAVKMAERMKQAHPEFNEALFLKACGYG